VGTIFDGIDERLSAWIAAQPLFFVGTAPAGADGHVNVSPKGPMGSLRVLDPHTVAYLDVVGSGAETIAHLRENGRIVIMVCSFSGPPRILRMHGRGRVVTPREAEYEALLARGFDDPGGPEARRAIIVVTLTRVADSCGYGVPLMRHEGQRDHLPKWAASTLRKGGTGALTEYKRRNNLRSIDGLPALELPAAVTPDVRVTGDRRAPGGPVGA
jgi:hypothetical protein